MVVHPRFQEKPILENMQQGLAQIWAFMEQTCPAELAEFDVNFPDTRENLERVNLPAISGLHKYRRSVDEHVHLAAFGFVVTQRNGAVGDYQRKAGAWLAGEPVELEKSHARLTSCMDLHACVVPQAAAFAQSKDDDVRRKFAMSVGTDVSKLLDDRAETLRDLPMASMSLDGFNAVIAELEQDALNLEQQEGLI